jgi:hypothetical protein
MTKNDELRTSEEAVVYYLKILSQHSHAGMVENHKRESVKTESSKQGFQTVSPQYVRSTLTVSIYMIKQYT